MWRRSAVLETRPAALFLAPETPYPMAGGGALRTASLLHYLATRYDVDLVVFRQPGAPEPAAAIPAGLIRNLSVIDLPANGRGTPARLLRNASRLARDVTPLMDRFAGFENALASAIAEKRYALGIVEHFWCAPYLEQLSAVCEKTVLDLHNVESVLHQRCAAADTGPAAFGHRLFQRVSRDLERAWLPRFSQVLTASTMDAELVRAIAPSARVAIYPNAIRTQSYPSSGSEEAIVFSGNLEYHPNQVAVRYFRTDIWPRLRERWPSLIWKVVGRNSEAVRKFTSGDSRISVSGAVDDAVRELARARVAIVPLLSGSGTRLKILEAWAAGLPVVSTTVGAEGLHARDGEHLLLADGAHPFAAAVTRLLESADLRAKLGNAGRLLLEKDFTWEAAWRKLDF